MKKSFICTAIILTHILPMHAVETLAKVNRASESTEKVSQDTKQEEETAPLQEIGLEDSPVTKPINESNLQNWLFAAGTVVLGTIAAVVVGLNQGAAPTSSSQRAP